ISSERIVLLSTHIVSDIEFIAKEVLILKAGQLIQKQTPQALLQGIADKVWSVTVSQEADITKFQANYKVGNIQRVQDSIQQTILSDVNLHHNAGQEQPNLEKLDLYYFDEEVS